VIHHATEHLIAGTGYRVDLSRLPFLDDQLRGRLRLVAGAPALSSSFEASAPDLYFVGLASAHSFGPIMRFLHGADYSAHRLVSHLLARPPGRHPWRRPCGDPWRHLVNMPDGAEGRALLTIGRSRPSWRAGACNAHAGPIVLMVGIPHPPISPLTP
jgi:hypothetical protein